MKTWYLINLKEKVLYKEFFFFFLSKYKELKIRDCISTFNFFFFYHMRYALIIIIGMDVMGGIDIILILTIFTQ